MMLNNDLMLGGKVKASSTIGVAGQQGFGVGVYPGDEADLIAMGLSPIDGTYDQTSDNYGNYKHVNGSIMVFVPAFCARYGHETAPTYSRDGANAVEVCDATLFERFQHNGAYTYAYMDDGWILPRAFVDGGVMKNGFFFDKYLNSKDSTGKMAISVKNGEPIGLTKNSSYQPSSTMGPDSDGNACVGQAYDAITLGRARGEHYSCATAFQWAALGILQVAHGQASTSADFCAWYDSSNTTNFPKGVNVETTNTAKDSNDSSVTFTSSSQHTFLAKAGSGVPFAKTTHNGQANGICDINGNKSQSVIGLYYDGLIKPLNPSNKAHSVTKGNVATKDPYYSEIYPIGSWTTLPVWRSDYAGGSWDGNGVYGASGTNGSGNSNLFGNDAHGAISSWGRAPVFGGYFASGTSAGIFCREITAWNGDNQFYGCRAAGYAS